MKKIFAMTGRNYRLWLAAVSEDGCAWGFVDKTEKTVIPCRYCWDYCPIGNDEIDEYGLKLLVGASDGKWGWIDRTGKIVIPFIYEYADNFIDGKAKVCKKFNSESYYIDRNGNRI
jgi:hypothetical protein